MLSKDKFHKYKIELMDISQGAEFTIYLSIDSSNIKTSIEDAVKHVMGNKEYSILSIEKMQCIVHIHIHDLFMSPN